MSRDPAATPYDELAARLMTPAKSGAYFTKNEVIVLARLTDASVRIGDRKRMLVDVLRSARSGEELRAVLDRLSSFWKDSLGQYRALSAEFPASAPLFAPWVERANTTLRTLDELAEDLARDGLDGGGSDAQK